MKALITEPVGYSSKAIDLYSEYCEVELGVEGRSDLLAKVKDKDVLVIKLGYQIDSEVFDAAKNLKIVACPTTGLNHINLDAAHAAKIKVVSLKNDTDFLSSIPSTAELAWALLLNLMRKLNSATASAADGKWMRDQFIGNELKGKTIGIVGFGRLGAIVAGYSRAFNMQVQCFDPYLNSHPEWLHRHHTLESLMATSDILSLHVPLNSETEKMIDSQKFDICKQSVVFINTSRGEVICEEALLEALKTKKIAGAALDVLANEVGQTSNFQSPLLDYAKHNSNLLISPHIGGATIEAMEKTEIYVAQKVVNEIENIL